jgi:hypothetical protein
VEGQAEDVSTATALLRQARALARTYAATEGEQSSELVVMEAADFVTGGLADFARAADRRGLVVATWQRESREERGRFLSRARAEARAREPPAWSSVVSPTCVVAPTQRQLIDPRRDQ